jgi:predicted secreted protein
MRHLLLTCALLVAGCMNAPDAPSSNAALPPPSAENVTLTLRAEDDGRTVDVAVGTRIAVALVGVPTAGYLWAPAKTPAFLAPAETLGGATVPEQSEPGFAGGNHWEVSVFSVTGPGRGALVLEQRRPWETNEPASARFAVTIVAR